MGIITIDLSRPKLNWENLNCAPFSISNYWGFSFYHRKTSQANSSLRKKNRVGDGFSFFISTEEQDMYAKQPIRL